MKSAFKCSLLLFLMYSAAYARDVILIENQAGKDEGILLKSILIKKFHFPKELINLRNINQDCEIKSEAIIHLCLLSSGDLEIRKINQYVVKNSLSVFLNQDTNEAGVQ